jgi:hypothetical protein
MFLSFYAYHGLRSQDWNVMIKHDSEVYTEDEITVATDHTHGYVSIGNSNITLWSGKTCQTFPERVVDLHPKVIVAILDFHENKPTGWSGDWLCHADKDTCKNPNLAIQRKFKRKNSGKYSGLFTEMFEGWEGVGTTELRKLWETHIRLGVDPNGDEVKKLSEGCGHRIETAEKSYLEFKNVCEINEGFLKTD